jgi:hypothetical protein
VRERERERERRRTRGGRGGGVTLFFRSFPETKLRARYTISSISLGFFR